MAHRWSKDKIALEILRLYAAREKLNYVSVQNKHAGLLMAAKRYIGSWQEAMAYAGLNYDEHRSYRVWTEDKIIQRIRQYYREGKDLRWRHVSTVLDPPLAYAAIDPKRFGAWCKALDAAGIERR